MAKLSHSKASDNAIEISGTMSYPVADLLWCSLSRNGI